ncbi:MAG: hypothetical protein MJ113_05305 [Lachnospiraceae bacterium]|nr:hypothetical protein [Lachnospiraceae bacterium]
MAISMDNPLGNIYQNLASSNSSSNKAEALSNKLAGLGKDSDDAELKKACESFEQYFVEQVIKNTRSAMIDDEDSKGDYMKVFSDIQNQEYARLISENANLGIAQKLYDSIKQNQK